MRARHQPGAFLAEVEAELADAAVCPKPMRDAPADGTRVLLWIDASYGWRIGHFEPGAREPGLCVEPYWHWSECRSLSRMRQPKGWLPLPPEPRA